MSTIRDVARAAKVSPSTVSFVLKNRPGVNPQTRRRVQAAIQRLGYRPRQAGRPSQPESRQIAVICGTKSGPYAYCRSIEAISEVDEAEAVVSHTWLRSLRAAIVDRGHHFNLFAGHEHVDYDAMFRQAIEQKEIDGVIFLWEKLGDGYLSWLLKHDIPVVAINRRPSLGQRFSYVEMDNFEGGRKAAEWFLENEHGRVSVIQADAEYQYSRDRVAGFVAALEACGRRPVRIDTLENPGRLKQVCQTIADSDISGVFITTDMLTIESLHEWERMGVQVPEDLSVIGFDNLGRTTQSGRLPSSIGYDDQQVGPTSVHLLEYMLSYPQIGGMSAVIRTRMLEHDTTLSRVNIRSSISDAVV